MINDALTRAKERLWTLYLLLLVVARAVNTKTSYINVFVVFRERTGGITFGDFMEFLSVISKGTTMDKLSWAFTFYDVDNDGFISKDEMLKVMPT